MALYTIPNSNPSRTINSFSAVASSNRIEIGGLLTVTVTIVATNFLPLPNYLGAFNASGQPINVFDPGGGKSNMVASPYNGPNTSRTGQQTFTFKIKNSTTVVGQSFYFRFGTGFPVNTNTETITIISSTISPLGLPSIPPTCGGISATNFSGNFVIYTLTQIQDYPRTSIITGNYNPPPPNGGINPVPPSAPTV